MTHPFREFKGHEWLGKEIPLSGGALYLIKDAQYSGSIAAAVARSGRKAAVYQGRHNDRVVAVKAFYRAFALMDNMLTTLALMRFTSVPGLTVCNRSVVPAEEAAHAGATGLSWSVVMPWIEGDPWAEYVEKRKPIAESTCVALASHTATILAGLEQRKLVHADISSGNVIVTQLAPRPAIELIDVEDMFHPTFKTPKDVPDGTAGYGHPRNAGKGCWNRNGDRFAGSILLVEMLTWHQQAVRDAAADVSLFEPDELCRPSVKYRQVRDAVAAHSSRAAELFTQAWESDGLSTCPSMADWQRALAAARPARSALRAPVQPLTSPLISGLPGQRNLADLLGQRRFQTSFVSSVKCDECGAQIKAGFATDHKITCTHHPARFDWSRMLSNVPDKNQDATNAFHRLMKNYSPSASFCKSCFRVVKGPQDTNHAPWCNVRLAASKPSAPPTVKPILPTFPPRKADPPRADPPRPVLPKYDDITFRKFGDSAPSTPPTPRFQVPKLGPEPRLCTECNRQVRLQAGVEAGHALLCSQGTMRRNLGV